MKKAKVITMPTKLSDLQLEDYYDEDEASFKAERVNAQKWRHFKHQLTS